MIYSIVDKFVHILSFILVAVLCWLVASPAVSNELDIDIQIIEPDAGAQEVMHRIELPNFGPNNRDNHASSNSNQSQKSEPNSRANGAPNSPLEFDDGRVINQVRDAARERAQNRASGRPDNAGPPNAELDPPSRPDTGPEGRPDNRP